MGKGKLIMLKRIEMKKELTPQEKAEQELADKIIPLVNEQQELYFKRANGVSLKKNEYIGERMADLEAEENKLKKELSQLKKSKQEHQ